MSDNPETPNPQAARKIRSYSEATRMSHVSGWRASGKSLSRYSAEHGISVSALSKWVKYYGDKLPEASFKKVSLEKGNKDYQLSYVGALIEIKLPNGIQLKWPLDSDTLNWSQLLGVLSQCS
jgi:transposase-like protein